MKDLQGKVSYKFRGWRLRLLGFSSTLTLIIELLIKGVKFADGLKSWGKTIIVKHPESTITMAKNCRFRSDDSSNLIGIARKCIISTHSKQAEIIIGNNCGFSGTSIGAKEKIYIGDNVICGANSLITDFDWHGIKPDERRTYNGDSKPVIIGNNVFIGYGSVILKGVTIGENSVIGANSVVTRSIPANVIAGGNPCKVVKELNT